MASGNSLATRPSEPVTCRCEEHYPFERPAFPRHRHSGSPRFLVRRTAIVPPMGLAHGGDLLLCRRCATLYGGMGYGVEPC